MYYKFRGLLHQIEPEGSYAKLKSDSVLLMLKKAKAGEDWKALTKIEMMQKEAKEYVTRWRV